jgi:hypothetical protein
MGMFVVYTKSAEPLCIEPSPHTVIITQDTTPDLDPIPEQVQEQPKPKQEKIGVLGASGITLAELEENTHAPLNQYAFYFLEAETQTGVSAVFLLSVAALESGWGTSDLAQTKNNLFGWTSNNGSMMSFNSKAQCIIYVAEKLKEHYLTPDGKFFSGYEVEDVNKHYNGREEWAIAVNNIMQGINGLEKE